MMRSTYIRLGPRCPTSRAPNHRLRLQDARAVSCSLVFAHAIPRGLAGVGAVCRAVPRDQAGVGVGRQHHQGDIEEALVVRRRRWVAWRGGAWTSSCDHAATSSAVLSRSFGGGASASVHRQSGRCTRWRASCASLCCAQRQVPTVFSFWMGSGCSTLTRSSMLGTRLLYGGL